MHNGMSIPMDEANRHYAHILLEVVAGDASIELYAGSDRESVDNAVTLNASINMLIEAHIQEPIDIYNSTYGLVFKDAHSCANYINNISYTHYNFCFDAWNFNVDVWEEARRLQSEVEAGNIYISSLAELKSMLPIYRGTV